MGNHVNGKTNIIILPTEKCTVYFRKEGNYFFPKINSFPWYYGDIILLYNMKFLGHENFANSPFWLILAPNPCIFRHKGGPQLSASF